jgi:spore coat protein A, manganese oxidase
MLPSSLSSLAWAEDLPPAEILAPFVQTKGLKKFIQPLRGVGPGGIPAAVPDLTPAPVTGAVHYTLDIGQYQDVLHPNLGPTTLRGYNPTRALGGGMQPQRHLGGIIVAQRGTAIQVTFRNNLSGNHPLPIDTSIMGAEMGQNRACTHLHGGLVPWISDGGPFAWWNPQGKTGPSFMNNQVLNPGAAPNEAEFYYPNNQSARFVWYHDHTIGITRLNAYAGIASAYIVRDTFESNLRTRGLPDFVENGGREIPIVVQDKIFVTGDIATKDPTWVSLGLPSTPGSLWYPHIYDPARWELGLPPHTPARLPNPSVVPEMFGDTMLANGTVFPAAAVEPRRYRLRILNACQARFLNLQLYVDDGSADSITLRQTNFTPKNAKGPDWLVIGTEGGFLSKPALVPSNNVFDPATVRGSLVTAPAERWDVIVDFKDYAGKRLILYNDAPAPFPMGDPLNDYFPGSPGNPVMTQPGRGPNTRQIMAFDVAASISGPADPPLDIDVDDDLSAGIDPSLVGMWTKAPLPVPPGVKVRRLTLNETFDDFGRLLQLLGTNVPVMPRTFGRHYTDPPTETPKAGATEVWKIFNLTGDTHPIHFHLINCQVLSRQPFNAEDFDGTPAFTGPARGPEKTELGWKDTVKMHPGEMTTVIMKFDLPTVPFMVPTSPRTGGFEYVWHCHILDHEEHDMMRPLIVR